jgi:C4-type Zn-finger protein
MDDTPNSPPDIPPDAMDSRLFCPLCHSALQYEYDVDYVLLRIEERCQCVACGYRRRPFEATIQ